MSDRKDGSMRLFVDGVLDKKYETNRTSFFKEIGIDYNNVISAHLEHKTGIKNIRNNKKKIIPKTDALVSKEKNIFLSVTSADCIPILFYEPTVKIVGIAHAGWRGIVKKIANKTIEKIIDLGGDPKNIRVAMGPGINKCHFDIGNRISKQFLPYSKLIDKRGDKYFVELKEIINEQLIESGIDKRNIENTRECTFCKSKKYFSYRKEKDPNVGLMISLIGIR